MKLKSINPASEEVIGEVEITEKEELDITVKKARNAFDDWKNMDINERTRLLSQVSKDIKKNSKQLAEMITKEMGKPIFMARMEIEKTVDIFASNQDMKFLEEEKIEIGGMKAKICYEPIGVFACISPWNFPIQTSSSLIFPALLAGNTVVFKPSELTPFCGIELSKILQDSLPENVFNLVIGGPETGKALVNADIDGVALTGSVEAGKYIAEQCGKKLRRVVLELGGSDPFIVCEDANIERATNAAVYNRFRNSGQVCISSKRFFVVEDVADEFIAKVIEKTKNLKIGNGMEEEIDLGPLVSKEQLEKLENQVKDAIDKGANILCGGARANFGKGLFYLPTILTNINPDMKVMKEEVFGPVMPIVKVKDTKEAIKLANNTNYGLGGSVWSKNIEKAFEIAKQVESGMLWVNDVAIYPPNGYWGGIKDSGSGRSRHGILDFVQIKQITAYTGKEKSKDIWFS